MNNLNYFKYDPSLCNVQQNYPQYQSTPNSQNGFNYGKSTNLRYDSQYIRDAEEQSTGPIKSTMDINRISSCKSCLSVNGPRSSYGNSLVIPETEGDLSQQITDIDSIMKNLNMKNTRDKQGGTNPIDVFKYQTYNAVQCNKFLDPIALQLQQPRALNREVSINRFHDLNKNPQKHIYYNWSENTYLEAIDNYNTPYPSQVLRDGSIPPLQKQQETFNNVPLHYYNDCGPMIFDSRSYPKMNPKLNPDLYQKYNNLYQQGNKDILTDSDSE